MAEYAFLDCGFRRKLERFGEITLIRPCPAAAWPRRLPDAVWDQAEAEFIRQAGAGGEWQKKKNLPDAWELIWGPAHMQLRLAAGGQVGVFPEQAENWAWLHSVISAFVSQNRMPPAILNCFAYTGAATLWAAAAGAQVCHVDGARSAVAWARRNAALSGLAEHPIRWIVEDVKRFLGREHRRGRRYAGIILDPPAFGRGPRGQQWSLMRDLAALLEQASALLSKPALFILVSCHAPDFTAPQLADRLRAAVGQRVGKIEMGEMALTSRIGGNCLPCGCFARWRSEESIRS
ncbi:MAG: class I SAM-dependent methyltransferase [Planctomycetota bacterium]|nr:class I SAM-dependent methyltransferase [Planctomycetota bacterium]